MALSSLVISQLTPPNKLNLQFLTVLNKHLSRRKVFLLTGTGFLVTVLGVTVLTSLSIQNLLVIKEALFRIR